MIVYNMNQVGPIPGGKEVVVQYSSDLVNNGKFYTGAYSLTFIKFSLFHIIVPICF